MSQESAQEMIDRLSLIALGERECDLSDNDAAALQWLLSVRAEMLAALKEALPYLEEVGGTREQYAHGLVEDAIAKAEGR